MSDPTIELVRRLRPADAERAHELFPADERAALLARILASPTAARHGASEARRRAVAPAWRQSRPRLTPRRATLGIAAVAAAATVLALLPGSAVRPQSASAVAFRSTPTGGVIAIVTDPFATQKRLDASFAARGFDISVRLVPVSPSLVGTVVAISGDSAGIAPLGRGRCVTGGGACPIGIQVARGFRGHGSITLGRPARRGESYGSTASAFAPGEALHCSGLLGARVRDARGPLRSRGIAVAWWRDANASGRSAAAAPPGEYVWAADFLAPGKVGIWTRAAPWPGDRLHGANANRGCRAGRR